LTKPPQKQSGQGGKIVAVIVGIVFLLFLIGRCGSSDDDEKSDDSSRSSQTSSYTSVAPPTPTGPKKPDATFTTTPGPAGDEVTAKFAIGDNFTEGLIKDGARFETIDILKYAKATYPNASQVTVQGSFPMKDAYGNTSTDVILNVTYLRSTLDKINFSGVDKDQIWEIRDFGFVHPELQP
jgi:hypothetical protein